MIGVLIRSWGRGAGPCALAFLAVGVLLSFGAGRCRAQSEPGHGWIVIEPAVEGGRPALFHLPPRRGDDDRRGTLRRVLSLSESPELICWDGPQVYLVLPKSAGGDEGTQRRVVTMRAVPGIAGVWLNEPPDRPKGVPSLPGHDALVGLAMSPAGPVALLRDRQEEGGAGVEGGVGVGGAWSLLALGSADWEPIELPWAAGEAPPASARVHLLPSPHGVMIIEEARGQRQARVFEAELAKGATAGESGEPARKVEWSSSSLELVAAGNGDAAAASTVTAVDGQVVVAARGGDGVMRLFHARPGGAHEVAEVRDAPARLAICPLPGAGVVVMLWSADRGDAAAPQAQDGGKLHAREIAFPAGLLLYDGPVRAEGPVTSTEVRLLVALLATVFLVVLMAVVRPDPGAIPALPGLRPAPPFVRLLAMTVDLLPAAWVSAQLFGTPLSGLLSRLLELRATSDDLMPLVGGLVLAWAHTTVGEWLFGRSIGKTVAACRVLSLPAADAQQPIALEPPSLARSALRNTVKWFMPPVALMLLIDPARRHAGDILAGTAVIMWPPTLPPTPTEES